LDSDVETSNVEGFEHDFGGGFTVLGRVERRFGKEEVVIFGLDTEVLEYRVGPEAFHLVLRILAHDPEE
jgi:hypothetical protein